jgi:hypothetical protein
VIHAVATNPPVPGVTSVTDMSLNWYGSKMIDGAAGDTATVTQLAMTTGPAGVGILSLARSFSTPATFVMTDGGDNTISGALTDVPRTQTVALDWRRAEFAALAAAVHPAASPLNQELGVAALPGGLARGVRRPWSHLLHVPPSGAASDADLGDVAYGDPFPSAWGVFGFANASFAIIYNLPGAANTAQAASLAVAADVATFGAGPIRPVITPVTSILVNSLDARTPQTGVGPNPTLSWSPPASGTPDSYVVGVLEVYVTAGLTMVSGVGGVLTTATSIPIPTGLMVAGRHYTFFVRAVAEPGTDVEAHPFRKTLPSASADAYTAIIDP